ncbi:NAD(P)H-dependent glycerol-3-phosphate dehydrogenase [Donghicola eburneus]|uniref:Glycerol-3-phosphate dehydrogenase [NAD(P)+] n=1 Tax=Donghicola eburneus TaxID=393278 RepID=A0A1M4MYR7_9RHOB|nr:NAD(P)H-dependent glycerol-3-phosphate dehydrogenase [Donghicola eburneus]SCM66016.1 putative membrane protein [Donghicola eburneus]
MARRYEAITVIGCGAWGTALAAVAARAGAHTTIWGRDPQVLNAIREQGMNTRYLPDIPLPNSLQADADMGSALAGAQAVMIVVPSRVLRSVCAQVAEYIAPGVPVAVCAKGIEAETGLLMTQVAAQELGDRPVGVISGPTFAHETALNNPTAATVAFPFTKADRENPNESVAARFAVSLSTEAFRAYVSDDVVGVEIGGAVKNVVAVACGMMTGAGFAENTRAALITRGMDEMKTIADALGGRRETVTGLSGAGDLTLTCSSPTSRNMSLGTQLGQGIPRGECFEGRPVVVEGEVNARSVAQLADKLVLDLPICRAVNAILHEGAPLGQTFAELWSRPIEAEPRAMDVLFDHPANPAAIANLAERIS